MSISIKFSGSENFGLGNSTCIVAFAVCGIGVAVDWSMVSVYPGNSTENPLGNRLISYL